jgi:DNA-binding response OmpR family regulator
MADGGPRVLLVDDDLQIREFLQDALADEGFEVRAAPTGRAALEALAEWRPGLILLDLRMPDMNGWEFRAQQRAQPDVAGIPVIVTTAGTSSQEDLASLAPDAVVPKPFDLDELMATVRRCLGES